VRLHETPVNPHKYMRETLQEFASSRPGSSSSAGMF
jgi:hypothetical protein